MGLYVYYSNSNIIGKYTFIYYPFISIYNPLGQFKLNY
jgi:hypothetical protein